MAVAPNGRSRTFQSVRRVLQQPGDAPEVVGESLLRECRPQERKTGAQEQCVEKILEGADAHALDNRFSDK
jgi:hypothetical protein